MQFNSFRELDYDEYKFYDDFSS